MGATLTEPETVDLLKLIQATSDRNQIKLAADYLSDLAACVSGDKSKCPPFEFAGDRMKWLDMLKESCGKLVYQTPTMLVKQDDIGIVNVTNGTGGGDGILVKFGGIISDGREDRDGDILVPTGADLADMLATAPLLFQHNTSVPIGPIFGAKVVRNPVDRIEGEFGIADTAFGQDIAKLITTGSLKSFSHGFKPNKAEARRNDEGEQVGWRITDWAMLEPSVVSVPSNVGAIITHFEKGGFGSDEMRAFGKALYLKWKEERPAKVRVVEMWEDADPPGGKMLESKCGCNTSPCTCTKSGDASDTATTDTDDRDDTKHYCGGCGLPYAGREVFGPLCGNCCRKASGASILKNKDGSVLHTLSGEVVSESLYQSLAKDFEVETEHLEASKLEYDWVSRHLKTDIRGVFKNSTHIPSWRIGTFLTGLREIMASYKASDTRNITRHGTEEPPVYKVIELNSEKSDDFLIEGITFYIGGGDRLAIKLKPSWGGSLDMVVYTTKERRDLNREIIAKCWQWAIENNFLKGEAFALSGGFLPTTKETFEDLFLNQRNESAMKRAMMLLNEKGIECSNRGMIFLGPPGTGKTLSGRIMRNLADATFIWISARDFYRMGTYGGLSGGFDLSRELAPSILFVEDVDNWLSETATDLIKTEMDGIGRSSGVVTILTTNYPERLPKALIDRPGRFHDVLKFGLPTKDIRRKMLAKWTDGLDEESLEAFAEKTDGYSGAHLYELAHFARTIQEQDEVGVKESLTLALEKIDEQRDLINDQQLAGSTYRPRGMKDDPRFTFWTEGKSILKRGRVLSSKNEADIKRARDLLDSVLKQVARPSSGGDDSDDDKPSDKPSDKPDSGKGGISLATYAKVMSECVAKATSSEELNRLLRDIGAVANLASSKMDELVDQEVEELLDSI